MRRWRRRAFLLCGYTAAAAVFVGLGMFIRGQDFAADESTAEIPSRLAPIATETIDSALSVRILVQEPLNESVHFDGSGVVNSLFVGDASFVVDEPIVLGLIDNRPVVVVPSERSFGFSRPLKSGSEGDDVAFLQALLIEHGFSSSDNTPDGEFGPSTKAALKEWQESFGFPDPDGRFESSDIIVAPTGSVVEQVLVEVGEVLSQGQLVLEVSSGPPRYAIRLRADELTTVTEGSVVTSGERAFNASLGSIPTRPMGGDSGDSPVYEVLLSVEESADESIIGESFSGVIILESTEAIVVPSAAVALGSGGSGVVVLEDGTSRTISIVRIVGGKITISDKDLVGVEVVIPNPTLLSD